MRARWWIILFFSAATLAVSTAASAQAVKADREPIVGVALSELNLVPVEPKQVRQLRDSLASGSSPRLAESYRSALRAAEVDPGILLFPDPRVDAKIVIVKPPKHVDPEMLYPDRDQRMDPATVVK